MSARLRKPEFLHLCREGQHNWEPDAILARFANSFGLQIRKFRSGSYLLISSTEAVSSCTVLQAVQICPVQYFFFPKKVEDSAVCVELRTSERVGRRQSSEDVAQERFRMLNDCFWVDFRS